jgi:hypothetical protein
VQEANLRVAKKTAKKRAKAGRVKALALKRETIKDLSGREKKKIKGGGAGGGGVVQSLVV